MKKCFYFALLSATALSLFSCTNKKPTSSSSSSSFSSSTSSRRDFADEELGLAKGHFIGEKYELDVSISNSSLVSLKDNTKQKLKIIDIQKEAYTSSTWQNVKFDIDYIYLESEESSLLQYRVFIPKEDYASLQLEKMSLGNWVKEDELYLWDNSYVGTWATTEATAGFIRTAVFSDEFTYPFENSSLKLPTGKEYFGESIWYPQFATVLDSETNEYKTTAQVLAYDKNDLSSPFTYYTLGPSSDENYPLAIYDVSWGMEYYYPSAEYYKGNWYASEGELTITQGENEGELVYNEKTYQSKIVKEEDYGWVTYLTNGNETLTLRPFVGGFTLKNGTTSMDVVSLNIEGLLGTWLYGSQTISVINEYDDDWNEVLTVKVNDSEVTPSFLARNKKFAMGFKLNGDDAYLSAYYDNSVAVLSIGENDIYVCAREIYDQYFVGAGKMYSSQSIGLSNNHLNTLEIHDDFTVSFNNMTYSATYGYDEEMGVVSLSIELDNEKTYSLYVCTEDVFLLRENEETYSIFARESFLNAFVSSWTKRGREATLVIDENYNVTLNGTHYTVNFDYDESLGFYIYFINASATEIHMLSLSMGTLLYSKYGYEGDTLVTLDEAWYIQVKDYQKIEGTYVYVGEKGKEYVIIDESETVKITTSINGEYVLKDYSGDNIRYSYYNDKICLTFKDDGSNMFLYVYTNGIDFNFFDQFIYIQEVLVDHQGYYSDGTNNLSIGGEAIYYNGTLATLVSAQNGKIEFTVNGQTYSVTFEDGVAVVTSGENTSRLASVDFSLQDYAGTWTVDNVEYKLETKENADGSIKYTFTAGTMTLRDYQVSLKNGKLVVTFSYLATNYEINIGEDGNTSLSVTSSIPLPPPPLPLA